MNAPDTYDAIPLDDVCETQGPNEAGMLTQRFYAFNTVITLQAFGEPALCKQAFDEARRACRTFERMFSRTLPHSDITRLNNAQGQPVQIHADTADLLQCALRYCADSEGLFDITVGSVVRLWDFHQGVIPPKETLANALPHVNWQAICVNCIEHEWFAHITDPQAAVDVGGIAKGWIADRLTDLMVQAGVSTFVVNLGGNVVAHGQKPDGSGWRVGLQDPREKGGIVGAVEVRNASAVTSGVYERCFTHDGHLYHHILDPKTGYPVQTDLAGVTIIAERSLDAEGYSTTLLALGLERGCKFVQKHPAILTAYFIDGQGHITQA